MQCISEKFQLDQIKFLTENREVINVNIHNYYTRAPYLKNS